MSSTERTRQLRRFAVVMATALGLLGALLLWRARPAAPYALALATAFLLAGLFWPRMLDPLERLWMAFAMVLGMIMTTAILMLTFYIVMTPIGLLRRIGRNDPLGLKFDRDHDSYWIAVDPDGPGSRPDKPY